MNSARGRTRTTVLIVLSCSLFFHTRIEASDSVASCLRQDDVADDDDDGFVLMQVKNGFTLTAEKAATPVPVQSKPFANQAAVSGGGGYRQHGLFYWQTRINVSRYQHAKRKISVGNQSDAFAAWTNQKGFLQILRQFSVDTLTNVANFGFVPSVRHFTVEALTSFANFEFVSDAVSYLVVKENHGPFSYTLHPDFALFAKVLAVSVSAFIFLLVLWMASGIQRMPQPRPARRADLDQLKNSRSFFLTLNASQWACILATDQYIPSLLVIQEDFGTTATLISFSLSINWIVKAFSSLAMPILADRYGRRPLFILCPVLGCSASLICACSDSIGLFLIGRVLQGIYEGVDAIIPVTQRDVFDDPTERGRYLQYFIPSLLVGPLIAPVFGGVIAHFTHWRVTFFVLAALSIAQIILAKVYLPETRKEHGEREHLVLEFKRVLTNRHLLGFTFLHVVIYLVFFSNACNFAYILGKVFHQNELAISWKVAVTTFLGIFVSGLIPQWWYSIKWMRVSIASLVIGICCNTVIAYTSSNSWPALMVSICIPMFLLVPIWILTESFFLQSCDDISGVAVGISQFTSLLGAGIGSAISKVVVDGAGNEVMGLLNWSTGCFVLINVIFWPMLGFNPPSWISDPMGEKMEQSGSEADCAPAAQKLFSPRSKEETTSVSTTSPSDLSVSDAGPPSRCCPPAL